jgi:outer membrane protein
MKKLLLSALAVCAFTFSNAQETETTEGTVGFAKGDMFVSGSVGFGTTSTGDAKGTSFEIAPRAAFFVSDNIAVGAKIGFASMKADNGSVDTDDMQTLSLGAFGRYYVTPASKFSLFAELGFNYNSNDDKLADWKYNTIDVAVGPGVSYFLSDAFAVEAGWGALGFETNDNGGDGADASTSFGLNLDMEDLTFGLLYKF